MSGNRTGVDVEGGGAPASRVGTSTLPESHEAGLLDRLVLGWNRLLSSRRFQRLTMAFPLTRPVALGRSRAVFDLCAGFVYTQTVLACLDLELLELLSDRPLTPGEVSHRIGVSERKTRGLLEAAESIGLLRRMRGDRFVLGRHGAPLLHNEELASVFRHGRLLYGDLGDPVALLRGDGGETSLSRYWPYAESDTPSSLSGPDVEAYSRFMATSQPLIAAEILRHDIFGSVDHLLDIGGGEGAFLEAVGSRHPHLALDLFDLPAVAGRARTRFDRLRWSDRARAHGGDFLRDPLPGRPDLVTLVRVVHDLDDEQALTLLTRVRTHLRPGGQLLIAEPMAGVRGAERVGAAYFFWYLTALGRGRARTPAEIGALLDSAGFSSVSRPVSHNPVVAVLITATV